MRHVSGGNPLVLLLPVLLAFPVAARAQTSQSSMKDWKDCFDVFEEAHQSRADTLKACCRGTFDPKKKNARGWIWHDDLDLYVDMSKCDRKEMMENLIQELKIRELKTDPPSSPGSVGQDKKSDETSRQNKIGRGATMKSGTLYESANFRGADLSGVVYTYGNADKANFEYANLKNANFEGTNFFRANFRDSLLEGANLDSTYLKGAIFTNAILTGASLKGAVLQGANFIGARVTAAQLSVAVWAGAILDAVLEKNLREFEREMDKFIDGE